MENGIKDYKYLFEIEKCWDNWNTKVRMDHHQWCTTTPNNTICACPTSSCSMTKSANTPSMFTQWRACRETWLSHARRALSSTLETVASSKSILPSATLQKLTAKTKAPSPLKSSTTEWREICLPALGSRAPTFDSPILTGKWAVARWTWRTTCICPERSPPSRLPSRLEPWPPLPPNSESARSSCLFQPRKLVASLSS